MAPGLICGTQPRSGHDISSLAESGVTHILNLQTDKDMQEWGVDVRWGRRERRRWSSEVCVGGWGGGEWWELMSWIKGGDKEGEGSAQGTLQ